MTKYQYITLREMPEWMLPAAEWFHSKWGGSNGSIFGMYGGISP